MKWFAKELGYTDEQEYWGIVGLLHDIDFELVIFWMISDAVFCVVQKIQSKAFRRYYAGVAAVFFTVCYLGAGWYMAMREEVIQILSLLPEYLTGRLSLKPAVSRSI